MKEYIEERAVAIANYIIDSNATVRQTAKKFGISKSTVHKDVTDRLEHINPSLAARARIVLDINKSERHIRGGMATKEKYQHRLQICSKDHPRVPQISSKHQMGFGPRMKAPGPMESGLSALGSAFSLGFGSCPGSARGPFPCSGWCPGSGW